MTDWNTLYEGRRRGRNPIALDLERSCRGCNHESHSVPCNGYRAPLCGRDTDVCGCLTRDTQPVEEGDVLFYVR